MRVPLILTTVFCALLSGCGGYVSAYEEGVYDYERLYCYQTIGGIQCHDRPNTRDEQRLVNYYGPDPVRYSRPAPAPEPRLAPPRPIEGYVMDPEPVPESGPAAAPLMAVEKAEE